jgi:hypothetical protein
VDFPVPTVKGNFGALRFTKVDKNTQAALPGVTFTLTCDCKDPAHTKIAASSDTGTVSFTDIPSGHTYPLPETLPEGDPHDPASIGAVTVKVSGGAVYVNGQKNPTDLKLENTYLPGAQDLTVPPSSGAPPPTPSRPPVPRVSMSSTRTVNGQPPAIRSPSPPPSAGPTPGTSPSVTP